MSYKYKLEGSTGGYPIEADPFEDEPNVICELCLERCTDDFEIHDNIVVCRECLSDEEFGINLEYLNQKYEKR